MLKLFQSTDKYFHSNGDKIIKATRAKVYKEDNGSFYLNLETPLEYINDIVRGNIIVANTPQGGQAFRISSVDKSSKKITAKCEHVFYDSKNLLIEDSYVVDKNCEDALNHLNDATSDESPFTMNSNITNINSYRCVRKLLYEALQVVMERWGGHLVRDNFNIGIMSSIGNDYGVTIRYAKNLKEINCEENWEDVVTKLLPVGKDGLLLPEKYVYSETQYDIPYTKAVSFDQDINEDDYASEQAYQQALIADLRQQAQNYVDNNCIPKVNYKIKAHLNNITDIGDIVHVIDERLGLNLQTTVISYEYDCILEKYTEIEFGNFTKKLSNLLSTISSSTKSAIDESNRDVMNNVNQQITNSENNIWDTMAASSCSYNRERILLVDNTPIESANNIIMLENGIKIGHNGINEIFLPILALDGTFDFDSINPINFSASKIVKGVLKLDSNTKIQVYDTNNSLIGSLDKNGLIMYGKDIYKSIFYSANETFTNLDNLILSSVVVNNSIYFNIVFSKSIINVTPSITSLRLSAIKTDGTYLYQGIDIQTNNISCSKTSDNQLTVKVDFNSITDSIFTVIVENISVEMR